VWASDDGTEKAERLGANGGRLKNMYRAYGYPVAIVLAGDSVWVADYGDNNVTRIGKN
jgi:hypothetical protein